MFRIESDRARFREIVRGRIRKDLRKYLSTGELIGRAGERAVSIPLPQIELPRFIFGENPKGKGGQSDGEGGEAADGEAAEGEGTGGAGNQPGAHILEVEVDLDELAEMLGDELQLPNIEPRGVREVSSDGGRYNGIRRAGPNSLRQFRRSCPWGSPRRRSAAARSGAGGSTPRGRPPGRSARPWRGTGAGPCGSSPARSPGSGRDLPRCGTLCLHLLAD